MTPTEIAALQWSTDEQAALVHVDTKEMPFVVMTKNEQDIKWLRDTKKKLDDQPTHPLCNKLELVYRPA